MGGNLRARYIVAACGSVEEIFPRSLRSIRNIARKACGCRSRAKVSAHQDFGDVHNGRPVRGKIGGYKTQKR